MEAGSTLKFSWKIKNFSSIQAKILYSDVFSLGSHKWRINAYPKGCNVNDHLSIYLEAVDSETLPSAWSRNVKFSLTVIDQISNKSSRTFGAVQKFEAWSNNRGWPSFIPLKEFHDPKKGFLVKDSCIIEAEVTTCEDVSVESRGAMNGTGKKEATEADMDTFFGDLNSVIFPMKVVSSKEEAKQALDVIEEALNMAPEDLNNQGRKLQLKNTFDVLSSLNDCSILTSEQKAELLSMKDKIIKLPERAANAFEDRKLFSEKELVKKTLDQKLGKCLTEFEKAKVEAEQNELNIATLLAQIGETKKKKESSLLKQKEMFKISKELKEELDLLVESWPVYEAKKKAAEDEEKVVGREWSKMKNLVSSLKKSVYSSLKPQSTPAKKPVKRKMRKS